MKRAIDAYDRIADAVAGPMCVVGSDGRIRRCNAALANALNLPPAGIVGRSCDEVLGVPPFPSESSASASAAGLPGAGKASVMIGQRWFEVTARPFFDEADKFVGALHVLNETTETRRLCNDLKKLEERMRALQKLEPLGLLAGGIAHDLANYLACMLGSAELALLKLPGDSPARAMLEDIRSAGQEGYALTRQLLSHAMSDNSKMETVDVNGLIRETARILRAVLPKKTAVEYRLAQDTPTVSAVRVQIGQVFLNLIKNASDAIGDLPGTITVITRRMTADDSFFSDAYPRNAARAGSFLCVEVNDTGCGMDNAAKSKLFSPFFTTKPTGHGLGLSATLLIVQRHGGAMKVDSEEGKGTSFRVYLPCDDPG